MRQMMRRARSVAPEDFSIVSLQGPYQHLKEAKEPDGPLRFGFGWRKNFIPEKWMGFLKHPLWGETNFLEKEVMAVRNQLFCLAFSHQCLWINDLALRTRKVWG